MRTVLSFTLPEKMSEELDRFAKSTGRNKSDIVKESLSLFLWEMKLKAVQKRLGPSSSSRTVSAPGFSGRQKRV